MTSGESASRPESDAAARTRSTLGRWLLPPNFERERVIEADNWVEAVFEPAALVTLIALFIAGLVGFGIAVMPTWDARCVSPVVIVVSVEAFLYTRRLGRSSVRPKEWLALLVPPLVFVRFFPYLLGPDSLTSDLGWWWSDPKSFLTGSFIVNSVLVLIAWLLALAGTRALGAIRLQAGEIIHERARRDYRFDDDGWRDFDHAEPLRRLSTWVLWGGVLLVFISGLAALDVQQFFDVSALVQLVTFGRPAVHLALTSAIAYFVVGLLLIAEGQYVLQRTRWRLEHLAPPPGLASRWVGQATALLGGIVGLSLVLPTDYALTISRMFEIALGALMEVGRLIMGLVVLLLTVITWPLRWLMPPPGGDASAPAPLPTAIPQAAPPSQPQPFLDLLQSLVFWAIVLAIVGYSLYVVGRRLPPIRLSHAPGALGTLVSFLRSLVLALGRFGRRAVEVVAQALPRLRPNAPAPAAQPFRWLALSRLSPDRLVEYYYLSVLERAGRAGLPRRIGETPAEYGERLPRNLPEVEPDLGALTTAFEEISYGGRAADAMLVAAAKARWQRLKLSLRERRVRRLGPRKGES